ncbi:MAG: peptidase inhibitor I78 [Phenylobacterium sp.]|uniref:peptidase inhibitor I78 n=1 Tax=Phenylobacterium sp. TaxID=1871053 RepID=UPI0026012FDD|nr:peptidase inhibitor I78 [Phenylobacterium sp.]MCA6299463.1 peptidase inhibitor I78 [Phenylobacterium sp.]
MKRSLQALALTGGLALLSACAAPSTPPPAPAPPPVAPKPRVEPPDTCGLRAVRDLVGQSRSAIPVPVNPQLRRVTCTRCVQTQDYNPRRLNIYYDADTGVIERVACG